MITDKYERILNQFKMYHPEYYNRAVDWWASGRISIGVRMDNGETLDYNGIENTIRWTKPFNESDDEYRRKVFGYNLQKIIPFCGMTKTELAEKLNITNAMMSRYIHGKTMPSLDKGYQLASLLGCSMEELFDDTFME